jgi:hypothetical protein
MATGGKQQRMRKSVAEDIAAFAQELDNVSAVAVSPARYYHGEAKVKVPARWKAATKHAPGIASFTVCDVDWGEQVVRITATKPAPIIRLVAARLRERGVNLC